MVGAGTWEGLRRSWNAGMWKGLRGPSSHDERGGVHDGEDAVPGRGVTCAEALRKGGIWHACGNKKRKHRAFLLGQVRAEPDQGVVGRHTGQLVQPRRPGGRQDWSTTNRCTERGVELNVCVAAVWKVCWRGREGS